MATRDRYDNDILKALQSIDKSLRSIVILMTKENDEEEKKCKEMNLLKD